MMEQPVKIIFSRISTAIFITALCLGILFGNITSGSAQSSRAWTDPVNISRSGDAASPYAVVSSDGVIHAIWFDAFEEAYRYSKSEDGGVTWSAPVKDDFPFSTKGDPVKLVAGPAGVIHVFWTDGFNLQYRRTTSSQLASPREWGSRKRLARFVVNFDVAITPQGNLHLSYISSDDPEGVSYQYSADGTNWSSPKILFDSSYLRNISATDAHIRVVTSNNPEDKRVYIGWDVRSQKRIYMITSPDYGTTWTDVVQVKGPEDTGGLGFPFGIEFAFASDSTLLLWQVGEPGAGQCILYNQQLRDGESEWGAPEVVVGNQSVCPEQVQLGILKPDVPVVLLTYPGNSPALLAWDGDRWSEVQPQDEIASFSDPLTFETIMLGCLQGLIGDNKLILVGCDLGKGGDIWFTSRSLASWKSWFSPSTTWSLPSTLASSSREFSGLTFTSDSKFVHAVWAESPITDAAARGSAIYYARWDGREWSAPQKIHSNLAGQPLDLSITASNQGRLELAWVNNENGDLLYSWANSEGAESALEWSDPLVLPSLSQWNSSPDIFVDTAGRVGVMYAVPTNEQRGIYMVLTEDKGITWSSPILVFDGVSSNWQRVDQPKVTLSEDGKLHLLFTRYGTLKENPIELYYMQSPDSGVSWSDPQKVGNGEILWSEIVSYEGNFIHRFWQEKNSSEIASLSQVSRDGGAIWENPVSISSVTDSASAVGLIFDGIKELHFVRLEVNDSLKSIGKETLIIHDSRWNGNDWTQEVFQNFTLSGEDAQLAIGGGLSSNGFINVCVLAQYYDADGNWLSEILSVNRSLGKSNADLTPFPAEVSVPVEVGAAQTAAPTSAVIPVQSTPLSALENDPSPLLRNVLGIVGLLVVLATIILIFMRQARRKN